MDTKTERRRRGWLLAAVSIMLVAAGFFQVWIGKSSAAAGEIIIYTGRSEALVEPLIAEFEKETGIKPIVRYGNTAELVALILEEGNRSRADVFWSVDAGALGALAVEGRLSPLPQDLLDRVDARLRSPAGLWVATSGRARVIAYNTNVLTADEMPQSIWGFTDPQWRGRIGWAPTNASFQDFITALRLIEGEEKAAQWLRAIQANNPRRYTSNSAIVEAIGRGEVDVGFVNHYYLHRFRAEKGASFPVWYYHLDGDAGSIVNIAGVGVINTARNSDAAVQFVDFLLSPRAQAYFARETHEYPVTADGALEVAPELQGLDEIHTPSLDLSDLKDLAGTLELLERTGVL